MRRVSSRLLGVAALLFAPLLFGQIWEATRLGSQQWELTDSSGAHISWHQSEAEAMENGQRWSLANDLAEFRTTHSGTRWTATANAQLLVSSGSQAGSNPPVLLSSVTGGAVVSRMVSAQKENPGDGAASNNLIYADATTAWPPGAYDVTVFETQPALRTLSADATTTGDTTVYSFVISRAAQVTVFHDDSETTKPTWLTGTYSDCGQDATIEGAAMSGYCATLAAGATVNLGGNCQSMGCAGSPEMYAVAIRSATLPPSIIDVDSAGVLSWVDTEVTCDEETTIEFYIARNDGYDGTADVEIAENTNPGNGVLNITYRSWADQETDSKRVSLTCGTVAMDDTMTLVLQNPTNATLGSPSELTVNIINAGTPPSSSLTYQEGADPADATDPAADESAANRRYVCDDGDNSNDGLSSSNPWLTVSKVVSEEASIPQGSIITFCRDGVWTSADFSGVAWGDDGDPTAFGAYGSGDPPRFDTTVNFEDSSYFTLRDVDFYKFSAINTNDYLVYNTICRGRSASGYPSNCYKSYQGSTHGVFLENLGYDVGANDIFVLHAGNDASRSSAGDGHWYISNVAIGNAGMEDCYDMAMSQSNGSPPDPTIAQDLKVFNNRCMSPSVSGFSSLNGTGNRCMTYGHSGDYIWIVGNFCGYGEHLGMKTDQGQSGDPPKEYAQISGNVWFANSIGQNTNGVELRFPDINFFHNTVLHTHSGRSALRMDDTPVSVDYNLLAMTNGSNNEQIVISNTSNGNITSMDNNWYYPAGQTITDGDTLTERQAGTSLDQNSAEGAITGISVPSASTYADPRDWEAQAFLDNFIPGGAFGGNDGADTPGAFDENGNRLGLVWDEISGAPNSNCGWAGLPIVAEKLSELGVTGTCIP